jgi:hypothetical protein
MTGEEGHQVRFHFQVDDTSRIDRMTCQFERFAVSRVPRARTVPP